MSLADLIPIIEQLEAIAERVDSAESHLRNDHGMTLAILEQTSLGLGNVLATLGYLATEA